MIRPHERPDDRVIEIEAVGVAPLFVRVPAGSEYRFRVAGAPNTREILVRD